MWVWGNLVIHMRETTVRIADDQVFAVHAHGGIGVLERDLLPTCQQYLVLVAARRIMCADADQVATCCQAFRHVVDRYVFELVSRGEAGLFLFGFRQAR